MTAKRALFSMFYQFSLIGIIIVFVQEVRGPILRDVRDDISESGSD
jgi:hypothetical protein